jgi:hypothetical protein
VTIAGVRLGDRPVVDGVVITFVDRTTKVSATVTDARGGVAEDYIIMVFPADKARRPSRNTRMRWASIREGGPMLDGPSRFDGLLPGEYLAIAIHPDDYDASGLPDFETLAPYAERFALSEGDVRVLSLRVTQLPAAR